MEKKEDSTEKRFRILVCIDGSDESYQGLRYAVRLGQGVDADITLIFVRLVDQGLGSGGFNMQIARVNMLDWGLELPGVRYLKKGRDILTELGLTLDEGEARHVHRDVQGDPAGDHMVEYKGANGKSIRLRLKVAANASVGILDQQEEGKHDLIILGASGRRRSGMNKLLGLAPVALKVAANAPCSVLVTRDLEEGKGHLLCTDGSPHALNMIRKDTLLASRCHCPITLLSVAISEAGRPTSEKAIAEANSLLDEMEVPVEESLIRVGDPVREIVECGQNYSVIVMADAEQTNLRHFFIGGTSFNVLEYAHNSVMIVR